MRWPESDKGLQTQNVFSFVSANGGLVLVAISWIVLAVAVASRWLGAQFQDPAKQDVRKPVLYFDLWRTICVACVVLTHCWEGYHDENFLAVCQWVLQFLVLISAICFARSSSTLAAYCARLTVVYAFGVICNGMALCAVGESWKGDVFNVQYQMGFVVQLALGAIAVSPLKCQLIGDVETLNETPRSHEFRFSIIYGANALAAVVFAVWQERFAKNPFFLNWRHFHRLCAETCCLLFISSAACVALAGRAKRAYVGWVMLALIALSRIITPEARPGSELHMIDLFIWAVFVELVPLSGQAQLGRVLAQAWPLWAIPCGIMLGFGPGRGDSMAPSPDIIMRLRFYIVEVVLVLAFIAIPSAGPEHTLVLPTWMAQPLAHLRKLSLVAYCTHKAVIIVCLKHFGSVFS